MAKRIAVALKRPLIFGSIVVLSVLLMAMGPVSNPPAPDLASYLNGAVQDGRVGSSALDGYMALSDEGKAFAEEAWAQIAVQAPPVYLDAQTVWLIDVVSEADFTNQSCCFITDLFAIAGYSSALSGMPGDAKYLEAQIMTQGRWAKGSCKNCAAISAWVLAPNGQGVHPVHSSHRAEEPPGSDNLLDIVYID